jgi:hypothetical protein
MPQAELHFHQFPFLYRLDGFQHYFHSLIGNIFAVSALDTGEASTVLSFFQIELSLAFSAAVAPNEVSHSIFPFYAGGIFYPASMK